MNTSRSEGFSLVELLLALSAALIAASLAAASWNDATEKRRIIGSGEQLADFISNASSLAVLHNQKVTVQLIAASGAEWCLGAVLGETPCDCSIGDTADPASCVISDAPRVLGHDDFEYTKLTSSGEDTNFTFDEIRGILADRDLSTPHHFNLESANGRYGLQVKLLPTGRALVCNLSESAKVSGYLQCEPVTGDSLEAAQDFIPPRMP